MGNRITNKYCQTNLSLLTEEICEAKRNYKSSNSFTAGCTYWRDSMTEVSQIYDSDAIIRRMVL